MRKISNTAERDTVIAKMKSGVEASILLDLARNIPDFLALDGNKIYNYIQSDITVIDHRLAHVILFEQKKEYNLPLYQGKIYIDAENAALLQVEFELNPKLIRKAKNMLIARQSRNLRITPVKAGYIVSYKEWNGTYYINHVRGDLHFNIKGKRQLFNSPLHMWFEMVTGKIDTEQVIRFTRKEILPLHTIFSETNYRYDNNFWKDFNVIPVEENLLEAIEKISSKIEETDHQ
ncbi:MAG: hypothetical protein LUD02_09935 [Tannerellaceae bacterium]|nr:hypothetical protein [Tannerellaceae bacterium]